MAQQAVAPVPQALVCVPYSLPYRQDGVPQWKANAPGTASSSKIFKEEHYEPFLVCLKDVSSQVVDVLSHKKRQSVAKSRAQLSSILDRFMNEHPVWRVYLLDEHTLEPVLDGGAGSPYPLTLDLSKGSKEEKEKMRRLISRRLLPLTRASFRAALEVKGTSDLGVQAVASCLGYPRSLDHLLTTYSKHEPKDESKEAAAKDAKKDRDDLREVAGLSSRSDPMVDFPEREFDVLTRTSGWASLGPYGINGKPSVPTPFALDARENVALDLQQLFLDHDPTANFCGLVPVRTPVNNVLMWTTQESITAMREPEKEKVVAPPPVPEKIVVPPPLPEPVKVDVVVESIVYILPPEPSVPTRQHGSASHLQRLEDGQWKEQVLDNLGCVWLYSQVSRDAKSLRLAAVPNPERTATRQRQEEGETLTVIFTVENPALVDSVEWRQPSTHDTHMTYPQVREKEVVKVVEKLVEVPVPSAATEEKAPDSTPAYIQDLYYQMTQYAKMQVDFEKAQIVAITELQEQLTAQAKKGCWSWVCGGSSAVPDVIKTPKLKEMLEFQFKLDTSNKPADADGNVRSLYRQLSKFSRLQADFEQQRSEAMRNLHHEIKRQNGRGAGGFCCGLQGKSVQKVAPISEVPKFEYHNVSPAHDNHNPMHHSGSTQVTDLKPRPSASHRQSLTAEKARALSVSKGGLPPLPEGWTVVRNDKTASEQYYHAVTKKTQSERPLPAMAPGWVEVNNDNGLYYFNKEKNITSWKYPTEEKVEGGGGESKMPTARPSAAAAATATAGGGGGGNESEKAAAKKAEAEKAAAEKAAADKAEVEKAEAEKAAAEKAEVEKAEVEKAAAPPATSSEAASTKRASTKGGLPPLPLGWTVAVDPQTGGTVYENKDKKVTQSTRPLPALAPGWAAVTNEHGTYYFNSETSQTQWKFPTTEPVEAPIKAKEKAQPSAADGGAAAVPAPTPAPAAVPSEKGNNDKPAASPASSVADQQPEKTERRDPGGQTAAPESHNESPAAKPALEEVAAGPAAPESRPQTTRMDAPPSQPPKEQLPPGWTAHFDEGRKKSYYHNEATGETVWKLPKS